MNNNRLIAFARILGMTGLQPVSVLAQQSEQLPWYEQRHGELRVGGFFVKSTSTQLLLESNTNPLAATVNFHRELGLDDRATVARLRFAYQFTPRHRLDLSYFSIDRDGENVIVDREIEFGDITIPVGARVDSHFDTEILKVAYTNMFFRSEKVRLGVSAGVNFSSFDVGTIFETVPPPGQQPMTGGEQADGLAPLPVFGGRLSYSISPKWIWITSIDLFAISTGGYSGTLTDIEVLIENRVSRRWGWGAGLERLSFDLQSRDDDLTGTFQTSNWGINLYGSVYF
jgi:hypothetical protein